MNRTTLFWLVCLASSFVIALSYIATATVVKAQPFDSPVVIFDYTMSDRFGLDNNRDGLIDYDIDATPAGYDVNFDGCRSTVRLPDRIKSYTWNIIGSNVSTSTSEDSCKTTQPVKLPEGFYSVTLTVTTENGLKNNLTQRILIKDLLIVSIGDSLASGQGNPDKSQQFDAAGFVKKGPVWEDKRCDRSASAYSARAALEIEQSDPHTSVTFLHFGCSGATVKKGLIGPYDGAEPPEGSHAKLEPQTFQVTRSICNNITDAANPVCLDNGRNADVLMVNDGINDIGFADIIEKCALPPPSPGCDVDRGLNENLDLLLTNLPVFYNQLADDIAKRFKASNIVITEYPDATRNKNGDFCDPFVGLLQGITKPEAKWLFEKVLTRLNKIIHEFAPSQGWILMSGMAEQFKNHGYCSGDQRWFRTMEDSRQIQGPSEPNTITLGTLHPNPLGHISYKNNVTPILKTITKPPKMNATIHPNTIKSKVPTTFVVHAVDSKTNETVRGIVNINNKQVGVTDTPFIYAVDGTVSRVGVIRLSSPNYPDEPLQLGLETVEPVTRAVPSTVTLNSEVKIIINATDPITKDPVAGEVLIDTPNPGTRIGATNMPFDYTFTKKVLTEIDDEGNRVLRRVNPTVTVTAEGYEPTEVLIHFRDSFGPR